MNDYIRKQEAINAIENTECELTSAEWDEITDAINELPSVDEQAIVTEYCRKRNLVIITMESFRVLQTYYNGQNGIGGEQNG